MKYAYLVFMNPYGPRGPSQGKTLLGVHTSRKSADEHFDGVVDDRQKRKDYQGYDWHASEIGYPDWCNRRVRSVTIKNAYNPDNKYPDWYTVSEDIIMEQWKVSRLKAKRKRIKK